MQVGIPISITESNTFSYSLLEKLEIAAMSLKVMKIDLYVYNTLFGDDFTNALKYFTDSDRSKVMFLVQFINKESIRQKTGHEKEHDKYKSESEGRKSLFVATITRDIGNQELYTVKTVLKKHFPSNRVLCRISRGKIKLLLGKDFFVFTFKVFLKDGTSLSIKDKFGIDNYIPTKEDITTLYLQECKKLFANVQDKLHTVVATLDYGTKLLDCLDSKQEVELGSI
jgi:hypothetical protein